MLSSSGELSHFQPLRVTSPTLKLGTVRHGEMTCFIQSLSQVLPLSALGEGWRGVSLSKPSPLSPHPGSASPVPSGKTMTLGLPGLENLLGSQGTGSSGGPSWWRGPCIRTQAWSWCETSSLPTKRQRMGDLVGGHPSLWRALRICQGAERGR